MYRDPIGTLDDGIVYGFASVISKGGVPVVDFQNDTIDERELVAAAHDFMLNSRVGGALHIRGPDGEPLKAGDICESVVLTDALQKALGVNLGFVPWLVGVRITDPIVKKMVASGQLRAFSIGGTGIREIAKGAAGNPGLVHMPGRLSLARQGGKKRRPYAGRTQLFQK
jgi:hypothetical protein